MAKVIRGRYTTKTDEPFVVFLIGMRINKLWAFGRWLPAFNAMPRMLRSLASNPEKGFLGGHTFLYCVESPRSSIGDPSKTWRSSPANISIGIEPMSIAYDPSNNDVYVGFAKTLLSSGDLVAVVSNVTVTANVSVGVVPFAMAYNPSNKDMYVADLYSNQVSVISGTKDVANISVGAMPEAIVYNPANSDMYTVNTNNRSVSVISGTQGVANITVVGVPTGLVVNLQNDDVYVTCEISGGGGVVQIISGTSVAGQVTVGRGPSSPVYDIGNQDVYVANPGGSVTVNGNPVGWLSQISGTSSVQNVTVGFSPNTLLVDPTNNQIYVTNDVAGTVMIVTTGASSGASSTTSQSQTVASTTAASTQSSTGSSSALPVSYLGVVLADAAVILLVAMLLAKTHPRASRLR